MDLGCRGADEYYLHNFLSEQPDLNLHNPAVQDALLDAPASGLTEWMASGSTRINFAMHAPRLRDNPPAPEGNKGTRSFDYQQHIYNQSHPDIVKFIERLRGVTVEFGERFTLAEVGGDHALVEIRAFTYGDDRLNSAYGFDFLYAEKLTPDLVVRVAEDWPDNAGGPRGRRES